MSRKRDDEDSAESERALAAAAKEFAAELRLTDVVDLITFIRTENHPNINDLVNSSAELYFKPGTLSYGWAADVDLRVGRQPDRQPRSRVPPQERDGLLQPDPRAGARGSRVEACRRRGAAQRFRPNSRAA